jgi:hypothetical protein
LFDIPEIQHEVQAGGLDITFLVSTPRGFTTLQIREGRENKEKFGKVHESINLTPDRIDQLIVTLFAVKKELRKEEK